MHVCKGGTESQVGTWGAGGYNCVHVCKGGTEWG